MKYISRSYIKEKYDNLDWYMSILLNAYHDRISEDELERVGEQIKSNMVAILLELGLIEL